MAGKRKDAGTIQGPAEQLGEIKATLNTHTDWLKTMSAEMRTMNVNFAKYNEQLEIHIQRTDKLETLHLDQASAINERLQPLEKHVIQINFFGKLLLGFVALPAAIFYCAQLVRMLMGKI